MSKKGLQQDMTKLKSTLQDICGDVKWLSQKFKENQKKIEDIVRENKTIEQKLDASNTKMLVVLEEVSNLHEKAVIVDPECSEEWVFPEVDLTRKTEDSCDGEVDTEQRTAEARLRNDRLKISFLTQGDHQGSEVQTSSSKVMDDSNAALEADYEVNKENEVVKQMSRIKSPNQCVEKLVMGKSPSQGVQKLVMGKSPSQGVQKLVMDKSLQPNKVVSVDDSKKCATTNVRKRKSCHQMMNQTEQSKQTAEGSARKQKMARTKSVLNQSVIDCEYVLKKRVVKEKQVMTPVKIKTEAAHPLDFCNKSFTSAGPLAVHLRNHFRESDMMDCPFPYCNHRGNQLKLTQHMRSKHTGEKLFSCYSCPAKFSSLDAKTAHEKKHSQPGLQHCGRCSRFYNVKTGSCRCC